MFFRFVNAITFFFFFLLHLMFVEIVCLPLMFTSIIVVAVDCGQSVSKVNGLYSVPHPFSIPLSHDLGQIRCGQPLSWSGVIVVGWKWGAKPQLLS